jgi:GntR family transcriptional regulator
MKYRVDIHSNIPPSRQLVEHVLDALAMGEIPPGERLPSVRGMASQALVNPNTVVKAYRELEEIGVVKGKNGSGVFVTESGPKTAKKRRGRDTLQAFRKSAREALEAGHGPGDLLSELGSILEESPFKGNNRSLGNRRKK